MSNTDSIFRTIYEKLGSALNEDQRVLYQQRVEDLTPNLRYCAYNIGDKSAMSDLKKLRREGKSGMDNLDVSTTLDLFSSTPAVLSIAH